MMFPISILLIFIDLWCVNYISAAVIIGNWVANELEASFATSVIQPSVWADWLLAENNKRKEQKWVLVSFWE